MHGIASEDPTLRDELQLITISFDPEHDTPDVMALHDDALAHASERTDWHFLTTSGEAALRPILDAYDQPVRPKTEPDDRSVHSPISSGFS